MTPVLHTALAELHGLECWSVIAGAGTGSTVNFGFGERVAARRFSSNRALTLEERQFEAEFSLYVEAAWRLEDKNQVLATWAEAGCDENWLAELNRLPGLTVESTRLQSVGLDLQLYFKGGLIYSVFCDQGPDAENYSLHTPQRVIVVGSRSTVSVEKRG